MFKKLLLIASIMVVTSSFTYAGGLDEKLDALHSPKGIGKEASSGGGKKEERAALLFKKLGEDVKGKIASFLEPSQRAHLAGMSRDNHAAMHFTAKQYLSEYLMRGESPGGAVASPMLYLTELIGMREQTVVFGPGNDYLHHTAHLGYAQVMEIALATTLTGKLTVASRKGGLYNILVDVARARPGLVQCSFIDLLPTTFEEGESAFLPGLHHKYASYRVFGTEGQIAAFQTRVNEHLAVLQESIALEYTSFEEAPINTKAPYIVIGEDRLAEKRAALGAYFSANPQKILLIDALQETLRMSKYQIPKNVSCLDFSNTRHNLTTVGDWFLIECTALITVDLSAFANVTTIGNFFLYNCRNLTAVDLSPLVNVTTVSNHFLYGYKGATPIDPHELIEDII